MLLLTVASPAVAGGGHVIGATRIVDHGPASARYNLVIVAEGFREDEQAAFAARATEYVNYLRGTAPFGDWWQTINVWRLDVASAQSGADDPAACGGSGLVADTYFDARFCNSGIRRLLIVDSAAVRAALNAQVPEWDQALVIVNSTVYGGSGGSVAVTSLGGSWKDVAMHEFGHSGFGLADEYQYWAGCGTDTDRDHHPSYEPAEPNVTTQTNPALVKWRALFHPSVPLPTMTNPDCTQCDSRGNPYPGEERVGLYEGAHYYHCDAYRPAYACMMKAFGPFCPVCRARVESTLRPFARPLLDLPASALRAGSAVTLTGSGFGKGSVVNLWVSVATGVEAYGPYTPVSFTASSLTVNLPSIPLGQGFATVQVVNTDAGHLASEVRGALLYGDPAAGYPTILSVNGVALGPADPSVPLAHADTLLARDALAVIVGTGFTDPLVNLFTADGNLGPLTPLPGFTSTHVGVIVPAGAPAGPGTLQVVNRRSIPGGTMHTASNAVAAVIHATPTITGVSITGSTVTVTGAGFSRLSVINLFNRQGGGVVNLGGLSGGAARVPLTFVSDTQFTFTRPAGAVAGAAFVEVLNPPFIPFSSSGNDPDGAFAMP